MPSSVAISTRPQARAGFARRKIFAHDDGVARHDAALEQAEQRRDHIERDEAVEREVEQQRQRPAAPSRAAACAAPPMRSAMKPEPRRLTMPKPSISDSISAPRADAVAEIAAIGDDVHLRHRHRHAAGRRRRCTAAPAARGDRPRHRCAVPACAPRVVGVDDRRRAGAAPATQRQHGHQAEHADADMGRAPADGRR